MTVLSRRIAVGGALVLGLPARAQTVAGWRKLKALEAGGARIGVAAIDTGGGAGLFWREGERFLMCSTFKLSLAAAVLAKADSGAESLDRMVHYSPADLLDVSPATTRNVGQGMRIGDVFEAAVIYSDNTAAALLLSSIGGPGGMTAFWRGIGDTTSRLDRGEPALNVPDGDKDTTTPVATLANLKTLLLDDALKPASRERLKGWLAANTTGDAMLRAGLPAGWAVGDKTGRWLGRAGRDGATNDIAIVTPPGRPPLLAVAYTGGGDPALLAAIGRVIGETFEPKNIARS
jgi:beta-lactamase class A